MSVHFDSRSVLFEEIVKEGDARTSGAHHGDAVLIMKGPQLKPAHRLGAAHVYDITPTLLAMAGLPVARDMDGNVLTEAFTESFLSKQPPRFVDSYETPSRPLLRLRPMAGLTMTTIPRSVRACVTSGMWSKGPGLASVPASVHRFEIERKKERMGASGLP